MIPELEPMPTLSPVATLRGRLVRHLVLLVLGTTGAILAVLVWNAVGAVEDLSEDVIGRTAAHTEAKLRGFFDPVREQLRTSRLWADTMAFDTADTAGMNALFVPVLKTRPQISSMLVADGAGREYMLLRRDGSWSNRRTLGDVAPGKTLWHHWDDARGFAEAAVEEKQLEYDPRARPWFEQVVDGGLEKLHWTEPYTFFTTKEPGITASMGWKDAQGQTHVLGVDVLLREISRFTRGLQVSERGMAVVLDEKAQIVGLPRSERYVDAAHVASDTLAPAGDVDLPALADAVGAWRAGSEATGVFSFDSTGETWWAGFRPLDLDGGRRLYIGVIVPEADFRGDLDRQRNAILAIAGLALIGAVVLALWLNRAVDERVEDAVERAQRLGQYTLTSKIGQGGIGAVYRARHSMLRRPCAVKVLRPQQSQNEVSLARFAREVQATAELSHPNTISIYDYGRTPDGVFYYAMEYLRGISLHQLVNGDGPQPPGRVIHILRQVCASLAEAHESALVHRDIKPGNVMLCERGRVRDFVKVLDFGLVKNVEGESAALTQAGALFGTPSYLSPEGIRAPDDVGPPSDMYAVGAVGYVLLTGTAPFTGDSMMAVLTQHIKEPPQRPAERLGNPLPDDLQDAILACLAKKPDERPSARELDALLAACADAGTWTAADADAWWDARPDLLADREQEAEDVDEQSLAVDLRGRRS